MPFSSMGLSPVLLRAIAEQELRHPDAYPSPGHSGRSDRPGPARRRPDRNRQDGRIHFAFAPAPAERRPGRPRQVFGTRPARASSDAHPRACRAGQREHFLYGQHTPIRCTVVFGGVGIQPRSRRCGAASTFWWRHPGACSIWLPRDAQTCPQLKAWSSMRPTECSTWASSAISGACSRCCQDAAESSVFRNLLRRHPGARERFAA